MATMLVVVEEPSESDIALQDLRLSTYAVDDDSAERADPEGNMAPPQLSGMRQRVPEPRSLSVAISDVNPAGSEDAEEEENTVAAGIDDEVEGEVKPPSGFSLRELMKPDGTNNTTWYGFYKTFVRSMFSRRTTKEKNEYDVLHGYDKLNYTVVDKVPDGLPRLAAFMNSDDNNAVHRRFGALNAQILVEMEIELTDLEKKLNEVDEAESADPLLQLRLRGYELIGKNEERVKLREEIAEKLPKYYELLLFDRQIRAFGQPAERHSIGFFNWVWNNKPLIKGKDDFAFHIEDFVAVGNDTGESTRFGGLIESHLDRWPNSPLKRFVQTDREREKSNDPDFELYHPGKMKSAGKIIVVSLAVCILLIPVMLLFLVEMPRQLMAWLVFGFVLAFAITIALATDAKVHEVFVGTAAYGAVLVTFLGNLGRGGI